MKNYSKIIIAVVLVILAIIATIYVIHTFNAKNDDPKPPVSDDTPTTPDDENQQDPEPPDSNVPDNQPEDKPDSQPEDGNTPDNPEDGGNDDEQQDPPSAGTEDGSYTAGSRGSYTLDIDEERFAVSQPDKNTLSLQLQGSSGKASVEFRFISGAESGTLAPSFVDSYMDYTNIEFSGEAKVGSSGDTGEQILASDGSQSLEAYLIDMADGVLAVVLRYPAGDQSALDALNSVTGTLSVNY